MLYKDEEETRTGRLSRGLGDKVNVGGTNNTKGLLKSHMKTYSGRCFL